MQTRAKNNIHKPLQKLNLHTTLSPHSDLEPTTSSQALKDPKWRQAMSDEFNALIRNGTWQLIPASSSKYCWLLLKQAPRAWFHELKTFLLQSGFQNSHADTSLFVLHLGPHLVYLLVYVDDLIITGDDVHLVNRFINLLAHRFSLKDLGHLSYFLGLEILPTKQGYLLSQRRYLLDLLTRTQMTEAKSVVTPLPSGPPLSLHSGDPLPDPT
jgi:hypothetical protein